MMKFLAAVIASCGMATAASASTTLISENFETGYGVFTPSGQVGIATGATYLDCCHTTGNTTNHFVAFGSDNQASGTIMSTTINLVAGQQYDLTFNFGALGQGSENITATIGGFSVSLLVAADNNLDTTFAPGGLSFSGPGGMTTLTFFSDGVANVDAIIDDVVLSTPVDSAVPEPATWAMMLLGFGAIGFGLRRRNPRLRVRAA